MLLLIFPPKHQNLCQLHFYLTSSLKFTEIAEFFSANWIVKVELLIRMINIGEEVLYLLILKYSLSLLNII